MEVPVSHVVGEDASRDIGGGIVSRSSQLQYRWLMGRAIPYDSWMSHNLQKKRNYIVAEMASGVE